MKAQPSDAASYAAAVCAERSVRAGQGSAALKQTTCAGRCIRPPAAVSDPKPLPAVTEPDAAWNLYVRIWRPGRPHPEK